MAKAIKLFVAFSLIVVVTHYAFPAARFAVKEAPALLKFLADIGILTEFPFSYSVRN